MPDQRVRAAAVRAAGRWHVRGGPEGRVDRPQRQNGGSNTTVDCSSVQDQYNNTRMNYVAPIESIKEETASREIS